MPVVNCDNISELLQRTLNRVDPRLVDHGKQVGFLVSKMLEVQGKYTPREKQDICFLAMLHDIGAYKTDEIDKMVQFETENVWGHSIYGYLFLFHLSPLKDLAEAVLFHHTGFGQMEQLSPTSRELAQLINLADRADVYLSSEGSSVERMRTHLDRARGRRFDSALMDLFWEAEARFHMLAHLKHRVDFSEIVPVVQLSAEEIDAYLTLMIFSIDFRSEHTVTHTITTTQISDEVARRMGVSEEGRTHIHYGAMLHDLGKIGIPVDILESPGRLADGDMRIMRTHVDITEQILDGAVDPVTTRIALCHHEKLDGSGYPRGLTGAELTLWERIVGVSDMLSALSGVRSYKGSFSKERTLSILREQTELGLIDGGVVAVIEVNFDAIFESVRLHCAPALTLYAGFHQEYAALIRQYAGAESPVFPPCLA